MKNPSSPKERNLLKGAMRRVFSRSDIRREVLSRHLIVHEDNKRPRVKKWAWCDNCGEVVAAWQTQVDHVIPVIPINKTLEDLTWDELVDRLWCNVDNLNLLCLPCHKNKSKLERKERKNAKNSECKKV